MSAYDDNRELIMIEEDLENEDKETKADLNEIEDEFTKPENIEDENLIIKDFFKDLDNIEEEDFEKTLYYFLIAAGNFIRIKFNIVDSDKELRQVKGKFTTDIRRKKNYGWTIERKFKEFCEAKIPQLGIESKLHSDTPDIKEYNVDIKASKGRTAHGAKIKSNYDIFKGLSYHLLVFKYQVDEKYLTFSDVIFVPMNLTADHYALNCLKSNYVNLGLVEDIEGNVKISDLKKQKCEELDCELEDIFTELLRENKVLDDDIEDQKIKLVNWLRNQSPNWLGEKNGFLSYHGGHWGITYTHDIFNTTESQSGKPQEKSEEDLKNKIVILSKSK